MLHFKTKSTLVNKKRYFKTEDIWYFVIQGG